MTRPSKAKQVDIEKTLLTHFNLYHSALYTAELTNINRNTVNAYFKTFQVSLVEDINSDFISRQKVRKEQVVALLERDLSELDKLLEQLKISTMKDEENASLLSVRLATIVARSNIKQQIADIDMSPTLDISIDQIMEKRLEEHSRQETNFDSK